MSLKGLASYGLEDMAVLQYEHSTLSAVKTIRSDGAGKAGKTSVFFQILFHIDLSMNIWNYLIKLYYYSSIKFVLFVLFNQYFNQLINKYG